MLLIDWEKKEVLDTDDLDRVGGHYIDLVTIVHRIQEEMPLDQWIAEYLDTPFELVDEEYKESVEPGYQDWIYDEGIDEYINDNFEEV